MTHATITALRAEIDDAREQLATQARDMAALVEHADALEGALATIAEALGTTWEGDSVTDGTARVLAEIPRLRKWERRRCAIVCLRYAEMFREDSPFAKAALSCESAIYALGDDQ